MVTPSDNLSWEAACVGGALATTKLTANTGMMIASFRIGCLRYMDASDAPLALLRFPIVPYFKRAKRKATLSAKAGGVPSLLK